MYKEYLKELKAGEVVFSEGEHSNAMYYIESGKVGVYKDYEGANQTLLSEITNGFFGEMGLISDKVRNATVVALEDSVVEVISNVYLKDYLEAKPYMTEEILKTITARIRWINSDFAEVCNLTAKYLEAEKNAVPVDSDIIEKMKLHANRA